MTYSGLKIFDPASRHIYTGSLSLDGEVFTAPDGSVSDEFAGLTALPGYADVHTHGALKHNFEFGSVEDIIRMLGFYASVGTLYIMPTIGTIELDEIACATDRILEAAKRAKCESLPISTILGIHYECRYLNPKKAGAHSPHLLTPPSIREADMLIDKIRNAEKALGRRLCIHFTIAPELEGADDFIRHVVSRAATVGIGHSDADAACAESALALGASSFTHTFNALRAIHHRSSSSLITALTGDAYCEFICDGKHILPEIVRLLHHSKASDRRVLITDSVGAGVNEGDSFVFLGGNTAYVKDGIAVYYDSTICGSVMTLGECVKNYVRSTGADISDALAAAVSNPLDMIRSNGYPMLCEGRVASFILVDDDLNIRHIFVNGKQI